MTPPKGTHENPWHDQGVPLQRNRVDRPRPALAAVPTGDPASRKMRLDRIDAASALDDLRLPPSHRLERWSETAPGSGASASTTSGGFVLSGTTAMPSRSRSRIITEAFTTMPIRDIAPVHPGEHLSEFLNELGIDSDRAAADLRIPASALTPLSPVLKESPPIWHCGLVATSARPRHSGCLCRANTIWNRQAMH